MGTVIDLTGRRLEAVLDDRIRGALAARGVLRVLAKCPDGCMKAALDENRRTLRLLFDLRRDAGIGRAAEARAAKEAFGWLGPEDCA